MDAMEVECWSTLRDQEKLHTLHLPPDLRSTLSEKRFKVVSTVYTARMAKEKQEREEREAAAAALKSRKPKMKLTSALMRDKSPKAAAPKKRRVKKVKGKSKATDEGSTSARSPDEAMPRPATTGQNATRRSHRELINMGGADLDKPVTWASSLAGM